MAVVYKTRYAQRVKGKGRLPDYRDPGTGAAAWLNEQDGKHVLAVRGVPGLKDADLDEVPAGARKVYGGGGRTADFRTRSGGMEARFDETPGRKTVCVLAVDGLATIRLGERTPEEGEKVKVLEVAAPAPGRAEELVAAVQAAGEASWPELEKAGFSQEDLDAALKAGTVYEPTVGVLKAA